MGLASQVGVRTVLSLLIGLLGLQSGLVQAEVACDSRPPELYEYRDGLGESDRYLIVRYHLVNHDNRPIRSAAHVTLRTADGRYLNDGYRPLVHSAYCKRFGCGNPASLSTVEALGTWIPARQQVGALAFFHVAGSDLPPEVTLSGCERGMEARYTLDANRGGYSEAIKVAERHTSGAEALPATGSSEARPLVLISSSTIPDLP